MRGIRLSVKLPALLVAAIVLTLGIGGALAVLVGQSVLRDVALEANANSVQAYASAINFYLDSARSELETTAGLPEMTDLTLARLVDPALHGLPAGADVAKRRIATMMLEHSRVFEYVMLLRADGSVYLLEPYDLQVKQSRGDLGFTAWYKELMSTGQTVISDLHISPATQRPTVVIATAVRGPDGQVIGVWAGALRLAQFSRIGLGDQEAGTLRRYGYVTGARGLIVAHQGKSKYVLEQTDFSSVPPVQAALAGLSGTAQFVNPIDGQEELGAYTALDNPKWAVVYEVPTEFAFAPIVDLTRLIVLIVVAAAGVLGLAGIAIVRQVTVPLAQIASGVEAVGAGDLTRRIALRTGDELELVATEFNRMASSLAERDAQLRQRAEELERANRELEAFSYSVSHDLRAPLRAVDGFSRILIEDFAAALSPEVQRYLGRMRDGAQRMGHLIDDLLAFSRLGRQALRRQTVDVAVAVRQALAQLADDRNGRRVEITLGDLGTCEADPALLNHVLVNLLSNAIKYTRQREVATIEIGRLEDDWPAYFVRDNGVGFDTRYADKLFGVFQRLHRAEEYEGTGVGLAIAQRIIQRHGGRIWAEAQPDKGATFYFTLQGGNPNE